jgi:hypothetical protein
MTNVDGTDLRQARAAQAAGMAAADKHQPDAQAVHDAAEGSGVGVEAPELVADIAVASQGSALPNEPVPPFIPGAPNPSDPYDVPGAPD